MPSLLTVTVCLLSGLGCTDEEVTGPRAAQPAASADSLVVADTLCARVEFNITSATEVETGFPSRAGCAGGLALIPGPAASWAQSPDRQLGIFFRVLNLSGQAVRLPVGLLLPEGGTVVLAPAGASGSKVVALNPQFIAVGVGAHWDIGEAGTLAPDDSTALDTLVFNVKAPVTQAAFSFRAGASPSEVPLPPVPNSFAVPDDSLLTIRGPVDTEFVYFRTMAELQLKPGTTGSQYSVLLQKYQATVVGGSPLISSYIIRYPDPGPGWAEYLARLDSLRAEPIVRSATPMTRYEGKPLVDARIPSGQQVPASAPDSVPTAVWQAMHAPENMSPPTADWGIPFPRNILVIQFKSGATQSERQSAVDAVGGSVTVDRESARTRATTTCRFWMMAPRRLSSPPSPNSRLSLK